MRRSNQGSNPRSPWLVLGGILCCQGSWNLSLVAGGSTRGTSSGRRRREKFNEQGGWFRGRRSLQYDHVEGEGIIDGYGDDCRNGHCFPTGSPTRSLIPSRAPSQHPTDDKWDTVEDANGFLVSTCKVEQPLTNSYATEIDFVYYLYLGGVDEAVAQRQTAAMETLLHASLTTRVLACGATGSAAAFVATELSSQGRDSVDGKCPDGVPEQPSSQSCWQVNAQITVTIQTSLSDSELMELFLDWINESLELSVDGRTVLKAELQGFTNVRAGGGKETAGSDIALTTTSTVSELNQGNITGDTSSTLPLGSLVLGFAAFALLLMSAVLFQRRRQRQDAFTSYLQEAKDLSLDPSPDAGSGTEEEQHAEIVDDDELFDDESELEIVEGLAQNEHNPKTCSTVKCPTCRQGNYPTFLPLR